MRLFREITDALSEADAAALVDLRAPWPSLFDALFGP
jgi:hypothetical protein